MRVLHKWSLALTLAACVVGFGVWHTVSAAHSRGADSSATPLLINSVVGDTFTPAPPGSSAAAALYASGALPESKAVAAFVAVDPEFNPPERVTYQLGTFAPGPDQDKGPSGEAVWALSWHQCPQSRSPMVTGDISHGVCVEWLFLHAETGQMIVAETQE
jgi:hypothetical protein